MTKPRVGFLGVGWIGFDRMEAMLASGLIEGVAICEPAPESRAKAATRLPAAVLCESLETLLEIPLDGVAIATPSALHAAQAIRCLEAGKAVFCQKPLGRNADETRAVVEAARRADRLLSVDFSYRFTEAATAIAKLVRDGDLGDVFAIDLTFHNAYGPDKAWFYDRAQSGGGCLVDLGVHLVDLALWIMGAHLDVTGISASLHSGGAPMKNDGTVEDYACAHFTLGGARLVRLACSWRLHAGQGAKIEAAFLGTKAGVALRNVDGSFYDFVAERYRGTSTERLTGPPDAWSGRAARAWCQSLGGGMAYAAEAATVVKVAEILDKMYEDHFVDTSRQGAEVSSVKAFTSR